MTWLRPALAAAVLLLLGNLPAAAATAELGRIGGNFVLVAIFAVVLAVMFSRRAVMASSAGSAPAAAPASSSACR